MSISRRMHQSRPPRFMHSSDHNHDPFGRFGKRSSIPKPTKDSYPETLNASYFGRPLLHNDFTGEREEMSYESVDIAVYNSEAVFDHMDNRGQWIRPRKVTEMHWFGAGEEWFIFKVLDPARGATVWVKLRPYETFAATNNNHGIPTPANTRLRAYLLFENGVEYKDIASIHSKIGDQRRGPRKIISTRWGDIFAERVSFLIGDGVGVCTPEHLCKIWSSLPNCDRRLKACYWYDHQTADGSMAEFIVLHVVGSSDFTRAQDWWVRLERDGQKDFAHISTKKQLIIKSGAKRTKSMVFEDGVPFEKVRWMLTSLDHTEKSCYYYASQIIHGLSRHVGDDYFECRIEHLWEIWTIKHTYKLYVHQIQWFKGIPTETSDYVILNVSAALGGYGLWVRWTQEDLIEPIELAGVSGDRTRLMKPNSIMIADIGFNNLEFSQLAQTVKQVELEKHLSEGRKHSKIVSVIETIADNTNPDHYWVEGDPKDFSISFSALNTVPGGEVDQADEADEIREVPRRPKLASVTHDPFGFPSRQFPVRRRISRTQIKEVSHETVDVAIHNDVAIFDELNNQEKWVRPRKVTEMHWFAAGEEWFIFKVVDPVHDATVWVTIRPYESLGATTNSHNIPKPPKATLRAQISFKTPLEYKDITGAHSKVRNQRRGPRKVSYDLSLARMTALSLPIQFNNARWAAIFAEKVTLLIGDGVVECSPEHLAKIWSPLPNCDRRLKACYWFDHRNMDGSAAEFIVLHIVGSSEFSSAQDWWVRLQRDGCGVALANDVAHISTNKKLIIKDGAERTKDIVFKDGIQFGKVGQVLRSIRPGTDITTRDCRYYASKFVYELSLKVENDCFECRIKDLWEAWSDERGSDLHVNQIQWFKGRPDEDSDYAILNVSTTGDEYGYWVRWTQEDWIDSIELAAVSRNRGRLIKPNSIIIADVGFNQLRWHELARVVNAVDGEIELANRSGEAMKHSKIVSSIERITDYTIPYDYWVEGDPKEFSISFSALKT
ncbi:hypothetical protein RhiJN_16184 [Ceratobasidium sp. AG-Ba]|nr:hypothetical protein RhiJN_16184 [Ceratobasidium sp. AG-Ba]